MMLPVVAPVSASTDSTLGTRMATVRVLRMIENVMRLNSFDGMGSELCSSILPDDCMYGNGNEDYEHGFIQRVGGGLGPPSMNNCPLSLEDPQHE